MTHKNNIQINNKEEREDYNIRVQRQIKVMLPAEYIFSRKTDDKGEENISICAGYRETDKGTTGYDFVCGIRF